MKPLQDAIKKKFDGSYHRASKAMRGVSEVSLRNLTGAPGHTRKTEPDRVQLRTALKIIEACWPHLQLHHFSPRTRVRLVPRRGKK